MIDFFVFPMAFRMDKMHL